jgi:hypothetical protein
VNEDGKITSEDVLLILLWSVDKNTGQTPTPAGEEKTQQPLSPPSNVTPPASSTPSATTSPATKTTPSTTPVTTPATTGSDLLAGKWQMSRLQINSPIPEEVPDVVINMTFPEKPTWEINRSRGQLQIKYDGKNTWYKKTFLGNGISESATSVQESKDGLSCTFLTPAKFYFGSLPFPIGLIFRDITRIQGSFSSTVDVVVSGNNLKATASIGKISGTFQKKHKDGRQTTESINFSAIKVLYQGTKK